MMEDPERSLSLHPNLIRKDNPVFIKFTQVLRAFQLKFITELQVYTLIYELFHGEVQSDENEQEEDEVIVEEADEDQDQLVVDVEEEFVNEENDEGGLKERSEVQDSHDEDFQGEEKSCEEENLTPPEKIAFGNVEEEYVQEEKDGDDEGVLKERSGVHNSRDEDFQGKEGSMMKSSCEEKAIAIQPNEKSPSIREEKSQNPTKVSVETRTTSPQMMCNRIPRHDMEDTYILSLDDDKVFKCKACNKNFNLKCTLFRHVRHQHLNRFVPHPCPKCGQVFKRTDHLKVHLKNIHGIEIAGSWQFKFIK